MYFGHFLVGMGVFFLTSCASNSGVPLSVFDFEGRDYLYDVPEWSFNGRAALSNYKESVSLSISWVHQFDRDDIELSGPFGRGRTLIALDQNKVSFDLGDKQMQFVGNIDKKIARHAGLSIPVTSLKYWVIGLVNPKVNYVKKSNGFLQSGWYVKYDKLQVIEGDELPKKIIIEKIRGTKKKRARLKLIIDRWDIK